MVTQGGARPAPESRLHAIVRGYVQGVGYRYFVIEQASKLGLRGWVRNLPDSTVEAVAEGDRTALAALLTAMARGPSGAQVADVAVDWEPATGEFVDFRVRRF